MNDDFGKTKLGDAFIYNVENLFTDLSRKLLIAQKSFGTRFGDMYVKMKELCRIRSISLSSAAGNTVHHYTKGDKKD